MLEIGRNQCEGDASKMRCINWYWSEKCGLPPIFRNIENWSWTYHCEKSVAKYFVQVIVHQISFEKKKLNFIISTWIYMWYNFSFNRLEIQDVNAKQSNIRMPKVDGQSDDESDDDLYRKLIIPNKIVPNRYARAMSNVKRLVEQKATLKTNSNQQINF